MLCGGINTAKKPTWKIRFQVKTPFVFSSRVYQVALPKQDQIVKTGATAVVSGFGRLSVNALKIQTFLFYRNARISKSRASI